MEMRKSDNNSSQPQQPFERLRTEIEHILSLSINCHLTRQLHYAAVSCLCACSSPCLCVCVCISALCACLSMCLRACGHLICITVSISVCICVCAYLCMCVCVGVDGCVGGCGLGEGVDVVDMSIGVHRMPVCFSTCLGNVNAPQSLQKSPRTVY